MLKTTLDRELVEKYAVEGLGPRPFLKEGQVFYADYSMLDGRISPKGEMRYALTRTVKNMPCF